MAGEDELIQYPADIGPAIYSLPRHNYRVKPWTEQEIITWRDWIDRMIFDHMTGIAPPPVNEDK